MNNTTPIDARQTRMFVSLLACFGLPGCALLDAYLRVLLMLLTGASALLLLVGIPLAMRGVAQLRAGKPVGVALLFVAAALCGGGALLAWELFNPDGMAADLGPAPGAHHEASQE